MEYSQSGNYVVLAGLLVAILARFNFIIQPSDGVQIISGIAVLYGVIKQYFAHKTLAIAASRMSGGAVKGMNENGD